MERQVKGICEFDCKWYADGVDAAGDHINGWVAKLVCYDDNSCVGYATDNKMQNPSHLMIGTFVDGKGLSICKIHATNEAYDPIIFDAFSNYLGESDTYYGEFLSKTIFNFYPMGVASIKVNKKELTPESVSNILNQYETMNAAIKSRVGNSSYTLDMYQAMDHADMSSKLEVVADSVKYETLPEELTGKSGVQPNSGN